MIRYLYVLQAIAWLVISTMSQIAFGQTEAEGSPSAEEKGLEIALEADRRSSGYEDFEADMEMILIDASGEESLRHLTVKNLEVNSDNEKDRSLISFHQPRDVRGTALLTFTYIEKDNDQWLYLPALKRVKTIVSSNKSGPFMGSEFSFEDMTTQIVEKYDYRFIRSEECGNIECYVVERTPKSEDSGYSREVIWLDNDEFRTQRVDYYDRRNRFVKTLSLEDYQLYKNEFWRPSNMVMTNHETGKGTILNWSKYQFGTGLGKSDFNRNALKRIR